jgi:acyl-CoA synthetase (AMP-forming)/AMP-acid ligase II
MEIPLTPMEFARRARRLYAEREAVVDGELRLTYAQFFDRCDRWSAALKAFGVRQGDRVAYIAPNTHAHLEAYYAVPQIGAVLVPINYRLLPDDFEYIINHCGATVVCAHPDYIAAIDDIRTDYLASALRGAGGLGSAGSCEAALEAHAPEFKQVDIAGSRPDHHQLHLRHHGAAERVMIASQCVPERAQHARASSPVAGRSVSVTLPMFTQMVDIHLDYHARGMGMCASAEWAK